MITFAVSGTLTCSHPGCQDVWHGCLTFRVGPDLTPRIDLRLLPEGWHASRFVPGVLVPPGEHRKRGTLDAWCPNHCPPKPEPIPSPLNGLL